jgi:lysophospholipase L1-like esterase
MTRIPLLSLLVLMLLETASMDAQAADGASAIMDGDRIVFVGDSITGQGAKGGANAWIALIGEGVRLVRPTANPVLIGLGGSGSTVSHWQYVENESRSKAVALDVKEIDVGKTLDGKVDIVVVMLGMNDVLSPSLNGTPADMDAWIARYSDLIEAIRSRSHPRVIAVATVTPCTEDPASPKNVALTAMNQRLATLAKEKNLRVLPTSEASYEVQALGRAFTPNFHVTGDFVHPNGAGHLAIAVGMLRGLGEEAAATQLLARHSDLYRPAADTFPTLSYSLTRAVGSPDDAVQPFTISYQWTASTTTTAEPLVTATVPNGWQVTPARLTANHGIFKISGPLDHAQNAITLTATSGDLTRTQVVTIPAGWRIATGGGKALGWVQNSIYDPATDRQPLDERLQRGEGMTSPVPFPVGEPAAWKLYVANNDHTGLNTVGSVDLAAVTFFKHGHQAFGARWIYSDRERPVTLELSSQAFAGTWSLGVHLNGKPAYEGKLAGEPGGKASAAATLAKGWNLLVFKSSFIQWQWQFAITLSGQAGDDLGDLRYSTKPSDSSGP